MSYSLPLLTTVLAAGLSFAANTYAADSASSFDGKLTLELQHELDSGWHVFGGYRTLEGGADNDSLYTFAWLHFASVGVGFRF